MSVGHVRIMPPSPSGGLYPDLSLIEDNDDMSAIIVPKDPLDNQLTGCKVTLLFVFCKMYLTTFFNFDHREEAMESVLQTFLLRLLNLFLEILKMLIVLMQNALGVNQKK